jgi:hypothetical protein
MVRRKFVMNSALQPLRKVALRRSCRAIELIAAIACLSGCVLAQPTQWKEIGEVGRFEFREPLPEMVGVVIGAPHGDVEPRSADLARYVSHRTGAGLALAYGFKSKRVSVMQPIVRSEALPPGPREFLKKASIFHQYRALLHQITKRDLELYVGIHSAPEDKGHNEIEVVPSGFTFEEMKILKESFVRIRDRQIRERQAVKVPMAIEPLERISWSVSGVKHHGVLMIAQKGLNIRVPRVASGGSAQELYSDVLSEWIEEVVKLARPNALGLPRLSISIDEFGRFESIPCRNRRSGIVIAAPHGSFDQHTAEMVKQISYRTGFAAVIAKGFTPTEAQGWRINVNRPTEKTYPPMEFELRTQRAERVYRTFKTLVVDGAEDALKLYIDVHRHDTDSRIQVATVGVSVADASFIKGTYRAIRDNALKLNRDVARVELVIEPLDTIEIGAWPAKSRGILTAARKSLHVELPGSNLLASAKARAVYAAILADLFKRSATLLAKDERVSSAPRD